MPIERGQIYFVNLNPVEGHEQAGHRPVLVLSRNSINRLPLVITVVVGTKGANIPRDYPTNVRISPQESGLPIETVFLWLDPKRFPVTSAGTLSEDTMARIENAVRYSLEL